MKKTAIISLLCSAVAALVIVAAILLTMIVTDTIETEPQKLVISSSSVTGVYNGKELTNAEWQLNEGELKEGHFLSVNVSGSQLNVGHSENYVSATVYDAKGNDVTSEYTIEYRPGVLNVRTRNICVIADSEMKQYDGTPLSSDRYFVESPISLVSNDTLNVTIEGSITEIGQTENVVTGVSITNENGKDVTSNYNVSTRNGMLVVYSQSSLVFYSKNDSKLYDGTALINEKCELISGELQGSHTYKATMTGSQTNVGSSENTFKVNIFDANGKNVTADYDIICVPGTLSVLPREVTVRSDDATKVYDGEPLVADRISVSPEYLVGMGFQFFAVVTGSRTEVGSANNTIESCYVLYNGEDVTDNFLIQYEFGILTVRGAESTTDTSEETFFIVNSAKADTVYLKMQSYGDLNDAKNGWETAPEYSESMNAYSAYYLTALALKNSGLTSSEIKVLPVAGIFALPYYTVSGSFNRVNSDTVVTKNVASTYTVEYYDWDERSGIVLPSEYTEFELAYETFVRENYLAVDDDTREYMMGIIEKKNFDVNDKEIVGKVARYIQNAAKYNLEYDTAMESEPNMVIAFLETYKEGVCRHYAAAATLLFRTLGIPARYTEGFLGELKAGQDTEIKGKHAHAWVEVYISGIGWVNVEVTGGSESDDLPELTYNINIQLLPVAQSEKYDRVSLPMKPKSITGFNSNDVNHYNSLLAQGYRFEYILSGELDGLGLVKSSIVDLWIYDPNGTLIYEYRNGKVSYNIDEENIKVQCYQSTLQVYLEELEFESISAEKEYDGKAFQLGNAGVRCLNPEMLPSGYTYTVQYSATSANVGAVQNNFTVKIYYSGEDVTDMFKITKKSIGTLKINAKTIVITAASAEKAYDGTPLACNEILYDPSDLNEGEYIKSYTVEGHVAGIGEASNVVRKVEICDRSGNDVTSNYVITSIDGVLRVTIS